MCIGIDVSENMVGAYNARAQTAVRTFHDRNLAYPIKLTPVVAKGLYPDKRRGYTGNIILSSDPVPEAFSGPEFHDFNLASVTSGFHHFEDCDLSAKRLAERLRPGGVLFILDFLPHGHDKTPSSGVAHHGFTQERIKEIFEGAGCAEGFAFRSLPEEIVFEDKKSGRRMVRGVFLARGTKS